jgi:iron(III) transport system permease protein
MDFDASRRWAAGLVLLLAAPALLPLATAAASWGSPALDVWEHQLRFLLPQAALQTLVLVVAVTLAATVLGVVLAWLVAGFDFPGRRLLGWALLLPLAVPGYVLAVVFAGALDYAGPLQVTLRELFGPSATLPPVRSLWGAALILTLTLYPYVYLPARAAFESAGARALEAAQSLGMSRSRAFPTLLVPMARPAIAAGAALVAMETLADFGVVAAFNVDTLTTSIYRAWYGMFSLAAALQMASLLAVLAGGALWLERRERAGRRFDADRARSAPLPRVRLRGRAAAAACAAPSLILLAAFVLPVAQLAAWALHGATADLDARYWGFVLNSLLSAGSGTLLILLAALLLSLALRGETRAWVRAAGRFATIGYAVPGTVLAIGLFVPLATGSAALQHWLDDALGSSAPVVALQGGLLALWLAYLARFLAVGAGPVEAAFAGVSPNLDSAAATLGVTGMARLRRLHLPLLRGGLLAGAALAFVDLMKELPITLMTRPFGFDTLAIRVFEMTSEGEWQRAALPAVLIVAVGIVPVALLARGASRVA